MDGQRLGTIFHFTFAFVLINNFIDVVAVHTCVLILNFLYWLLSRKKSIGADVYLANFIAVLLK